MSSRERAQETYLLPSNAVRKTSQVPNKPDISHEKYFSLVCSPSLCATTESLRILLSFLPNCLFSAFLYFSVSANRLSLPSNIWTPHQTPTSASTKPLQPAVGHPPPLFQSQPSGWRSPYLRGLWWQFWGFWCSSLKLRI